MPPKTPVLGNMIASQKFRLGRLELDDIDNSVIPNLNISKIVEQQICLFHRDIPSGNHYFNILHKRIEQGLTDKVATPVVRFADGEYAFYRDSLNCNGLYQQAESVEAIKRAMPAHIEALQILSRSGMLAPLIFPGNTHRERRSFFSFWRKSKTDSSAVKFIDFLFSHDIQLDQNNYIPFYVVYAYLTSEQFARLVDNKKVCLITSEYHMDSCKQWFARFRSYPTLIIVDIPDSYVATRWSSIKENVLKRVPGEAGLCLVGAGVGALLVCVDVARHFSIPAIDAGHVLNMMNGRQDKSKGPRLYTLRKSRRVFDG